MREYDWALAHSWGPHSAQWGTVGNARENMIGLRPTRGDHTRFNGGTVGDAREKMMQATAHRRWWENLATAHNMIGEG